MKKISFILSICSFNIVTYAQEGSMSAGGDVTGGSGSVSYSIGQIKYLSATDGNYSVSQGVQQPYEISVVTAALDPEIDLELNVYPNPTVNGVKLNSNKNIIDLSYQLTDISGKIVSKQKLNDLSTNIEMDKLTNGNYIISVYQNETIIKTFKIIKNQ